MAGQGSRRASTLNMTSKSGRTAAGRGFKFGLKEQLALLLTVAVLLGGGGSGAGFNNLVIQIVALVLLAVNYSAVEDFVRSGPRVLVWLAGASLALPLLQCIPLPPAVWQALPGRELVLQSLALIGEEDRWFPITVDRNRTLLAAFSLVTPITVLVLGNNLGTRDRNFILRVIVALGFVSLALGAIQLASGGAVGILYPYSIKGVLFGTFGNRNSTALFLVICMISYFAVSENPKKTAWRALHFVVFLLFAIGVLVTQSRSGAILLALAVAVQLALSLMGMRKGLLGGLGGTARVAVWVGSLITLALALVAAIAIGWGGTRLDLTVWRFSNIDTVRLLIWEDALISAERYWPVGSGFSTFDEVFQIDESLEYLDDLRAGRAHNDYLELVIEAGFAGIVLALFWLSWLVSRGWQAFKTRQGAVVRAAGLSIVAILGQSIIDYPLRNQALLCVAALMVSLLARIPRSQENRGSSVGQASDELLVPETRA